VQYLNEEREDIGVQAYQGLAAMLKAGTTEEAIAKWMETHFP
jgi:hypothetical protein